MTHADVVADLRSFYEKEAELGLRGPLRGRRVEARNKFVALLRSEARTRVVDFGSGPGRDASGFLDAGIGFVGIDLAVGNARLAAANNVSVVASSIAAPPFRPRSFDAAWSMSTFMHVPEPEAAQVAAAMAGPLWPGAPLMVGVWGGIRRDEIEQTKLPGEQRLFSLRTAVHNQTLLEAAGATEHLETWDIGPDGWEYQLFLVRASTQDHPTQA